jgi:hypothetical protein
MLPEATAPKLTTEVKDSFAKIIDLRCFVSIHASVLLQGPSQLQTLADLPKGVERSRVSMSFPAFVERELRSSQSAGLRQGRNLRLVLLGSAQ